MRIGIDGFNLAMPHGTGVSTYGHSLGATLVERGHRIEGIFGLDAGKLPETREAMFFDRLARPVPEPRSPVRRKIATARLRRGAWAEDVPVTGSVDARSLAGRLPPFARIVTSPFLFERAQRLFSATGRFAELRVADPPQIMHWTYPVPVRLRDAHNLYTVHDMVPLRLPHATLDAKQRHHRLISACIANADRIVTVSEASARDICELFGIPSEFVVNTYQVAPIPTGAQKPSAEDRQALTDLFGLVNDGYFLFYGAIEPKKNVGRLLEAYLSLGTATPLVMVGTRSWQAESELCLLPKEDDPRRAAFAKRVIRLDYLPRHLLLALVRGARAVMFPSLYEGFGLPAHEAMLLGTPVLAGNTSAMPEVAGDAALLVDPYDVASIRAAIGRLDQDAALRLDLRRRGSLHAATFSSRRYGEALDSLYQDVLAAGSHRGRR